MIVDHRAVVLLVLRLVTAEPGSGTAAGSDAHPPEPAGSGSECAVHRAGCKPGEVPPSPRPADHRCRERLRFGRRTPGSGRAHTRARSEATQ